MTITLKQLQDSLLVAKALQKNKEATVLDDFIHFFKTRGWLTLRQNLYAQTLVDSNTQE